MFDFFGFCHILPTIQFLQQFQKHLLLLNELRQTHPGSNNHSSAINLIPQCSPPPPTPLPTFFLYLLAQTSLSSAVVDCVSVYALCHAGVPV